MDISTDLISSSSMKLLSIIATFIVTLLIPKARHLLIYCLRASFVKWRALVSILSLLILVHIFYLNSFTKNLDFTPKIAQSFTLGILIFYVLTTILLTTLYSIWIDFIKMPDGIFKIAILGSFSNSEKSNLQVDNDSEIINLTIKKHCNEITSSHVAFKIGLLNYYYQEVPSLFPSILGIKLMESFWNWKLRKNHFISYIGFIKEVNKSGIYLISGIGEHNLNNVDTFNSFVKISNDLMQEGVIKEDRHIRICINIYFMLLGQSMIYFLRTVDKYDIIHEIIDNSEELLNKVVNECKSIPKEKIQDLNEFINHYKAYFKQYRGYIYSLQKNYTGCIDNIFEAIKLQPYFPTKSYEEFKLRTTHIHAIALGNSLPSIVEVLEKSRENDSTELPNPDSFRINKLRLEESLTYKDLDFHHDLLEQIISIDLNELDKQFLKKQLLSLDDNLEVNLFIKAQLLRQLEKDFKKGNEIGISYLSKLLEKDSTFPVAQLKIGTWMMLNSEFISNKKQSKIEMNKYSEFLKKGFSLFHKLGYN